MARHRFLLAYCAPVLVFATLPAAPANAWGQTPVASQGDSRFVGTIQDIAPIRDQTAAIVSRLELLLEGEGQTCDSRAYREALRQLERLAARAQELVDREAGYRARTGAAPRPIDLEAERTNAAIRERLERWRARLAECARRARPAATTGRGGRQGRPPPGPDYSLPAPDTVPGDLARRFFRLNVEFLDAALSCNLAQMRAMLAQLEQLAAEFSRATEAAREVGSAGTAEARNLARVDAIVQASLELARQQLRACEERAAVTAQPPAVENEDPEYPDDDAPPASPTPPASPPAAVTPPAPPPASEDERPIVHDIEVQTPGETRVTGVPGVAGTVTAIAGELQQPPSSPADADEEEYPDDDAPSSLPTLQERLATLVSDAEAAPRSCADNELNVIIFRLEAMLAVALADQRRLRREAILATSEADQSRYERAVTELDLARIAEEDTREALRQALTLRDGYCLPPGAHGTGGTIFVIPGVQGITLPGTAIGITRAGPPGAAPELSGADTPRTVPRIGVRAGYATGSGALSAEGHYFEGDEMMLFAIPSAAGTDTGRVNGALSPGGSSGIIGPFGLDGQVRTESTSYGLRVSLEVANTNDDSVDDPAPARDDRRPGESWEDFALRLFYYIDRTETSYSGLLNGRAVIGGTTFGFTQEREQEVDETRVGVGAEGLLEIRLGGNVAFTGSASAGVYHRWTSLASLERNTCTFCVAPDGNFTIAIEDEDRGFGLHGGLGAGFDFRVSPRVSIGVGGQVDYWSRVGRVFNPNSGDQVFIERLTTGLRTDDTWSWNVGARVILRLGR